MKLLLQIIRFGVGVLFIFSGLVKANDPMGLAYKMEEFFEIWLLFWMIPFTKTLSIGMNALEIISGFALLIGWQNKWNLRMLMLLIIFFTFLTGYTYYTGYPKTCGCFGDCLPISSATSFFKDVILLACIGLLLFKQSLLDRSLTVRTAQILMLLATAFSFGLQFYVLRHLPLVDCLPYRQGTNLIEARKQPPPPPGSTVMFVYMKGGKEIEFPADKFPDDFSADTYTFVRRYDTGEIPQAPIQGLVLYNQNGTDTTESILATDQCIMVFGQDMALLTQNRAAWDRIYSQAIKKNIPMIWVSNQTESMIEWYRNNYPAITVVSCDRTPIRTAARVDPTLYFLEKATIKGKWAGEDWSNFAEFLNK